MNIALVIAGGAGSRTGQNIPKQFLTVDDKPIIIYTLENICSVKEIDKIVVVISEGWDMFLNSYIMQYGISKVDTLIHGGNTRHQSIFNGIEYIYKNYGKDDCVIITDANRPMIPKEVFAANIQECVKSGDFTVSCEPCYDSMYLSKGGKVIDASINREELLKGQSPECGKVGKMFSLYQMANEQKYDNISTTDLCIMFGEKVKVIKGSSKAFKITTKDDIELFKALARISTKNLI